MTKILDGLKVLVTRPEQQAEALCEAIENLGGRAICFPVIEITQSENQLAAKNYSGKYSSIRYRDLY